jgi:hypothetical protein
VRVQACLIARVWIDERVVCLEAISNSSHSFVVSQCSVPWPVYNDSSHDGPRNRNLHVRGKHTACMVLCDRDARAPIGEYQEILGCDMNVAAQLRKAVDWREEAAGDGKGRGYDKA